MNNMASIRLMGNNKIRWDGVCSITFVKGDTLKNDVTHFRLDTAFVEITRMTTISIYSIWQEKFLKCYSLINLNNTVLSSKMFDRSI